MNHTVSNPTRIQIVEQGPSRMNITQAKQRLGCSTIVNFQLFNMGNLSAACCLKVGGYVKANDGTNYWGYGWNNDDTKLALGRRLEIMDRFQNFAGCVLVAKDGKAITSPECANLFPGIRGRTCIGRKANGDIVIYCWPDGSAGACSIYGLGQRMVSLGCVDAINYDGGGSCQLICPSGSVYSQRLVGNFLCLWTKDDEEEPTPTPSRCPFPEPTVNVMIGSKGMAASWVQWNLNQHGSNLSVDGVFGSLTYGALLDFQKKKGLTPDGICGPLTRAALKQH